MHKLVKTPSIPKAKARLWASGQQERNGGECEEGKDEVDKE